MALSSPRFKWMCASASLSFDEDMDVESCLKGDAASSKAVELFLSDEGSPEVLFFVQVGGKSDSPRDVGEGAEEASATLRIMAHAGPIGTGLAANKSKLVYFLRSAIKTSAVDITVAQDAHVLFGELAAGDVTASVSSMLKNGVAPLVESMSVQGKSSMQHVNEYMKALSRFTHELVI